MRRLASLTCTMWCFAALAAWLVVGCVMASRIGAPEIFKAMNATLVIDWLADAARSHPLIAAWFACGLAAAGMLMLNLLASLWTRLVPQARRHRDAERTAMLLVHLLFAVVLIGHLSDITVGFKHTGIRLSPGEQAELDDGYAVRVATIDFTDNPELLRHSRSDPRGRMTRAEFHPEANPVTVQVLRNGETLMDGTVRVLAPLVREGLRLTLTRIERDDALDAPLRAVFALSWNPLHEVFFCVYAVMIACIVVLALRLARRETARIGGARTGGPQ